MTSPAAPNEEHVHHYILPPPNGLVSLGVCRDCGLTREFSNAEPETSIAKAGKAARRRGTQASVAPRGEHTRVLTAKGGMR